MMIEPRLAAGCDMIGLISRLRGWLADAQLIFPPQRSKTAPTSALSISSPRYATISANAARVIMLAWRLAFIASKIPRRESPDSTPSMISPSNAIQSDALRRALNGVIAEAFIADVSSNTSFRARFERIILYSNAAQRQLKMAIVTPRATTEPISERVTERQFRSFHQPPHTRTDDEMIILRYAFNASTAIASLSAVAATWSSALVSPLYALAGEVPGDSPNCRRFQQNATNTIFMAAPLALHRGIERYRQHDTPRVGAFDAAKCEVPSSELSMSSALIILDSSSIANFLQQSAKASSNA